jgi:hypothetical protein
VHKRELEQESNHDQVMGSSRTTEGGNMIVSSLPKKRRLAPDLASLSREELIEEVLEEREKRQRLSERYENRIDSLLRLLEGKTSNERS